jgi:hypothetical protein
VNYELQYGKEFTGIKKAFVSGWQTNMIAIWQTGKPFTVVNSGIGADSPEGLGFNNRATPQNNSGGGMGADRPNQIAPAETSSHPLSRFFNTAAFAPQPLGTVGNTQRNSLFGPSFRHVDLSLFKTFPIKEQLNVQFRVEAFNISNTPNFFMGNKNDTTNVQFGTSAFGTISQTDPNYVPRQYQFALKVQF